MGMNAMNDERMDLYKYSLQLEDRLKESRIILQNPVESMELISRKWMIGKNRRIN